MSCKVEWPCLTESTAFSDQVTGNLKFEAVLLRMGGFASATLTKGLEFSQREKNRYALRSNTSLETRCLLQTLLMNNQEDWNR